MAPKLFYEWRLRRGAAAYVHSLSAEPEDGDVRWLAEVATGGDVDRARWELRYARRALGLLVAERDALDDRTGSAVARELSEALPMDRNVAAGMVRVAERQFNDRLLVYRQVLSIRNATEGTAARIGRALILSTGAPGADEDSVVRAGEIMARYLGSASEALRKAFGAAALPEDRPPSDLQGSRRG